jgi:hypothetical protein
MLKKAKIKVEKIYSKDFKKMLETFDEVEFETEKEFESSLEKGFFIVLSSQALFEKIEISTFFTRGV